MRSAAREPASSSSSSSSTAPAGEPTVSQVTSPSDAPLRSDAAVYSNDAVPSDAAVYSNDAVPSSAAVYSNGAVPSSAAVYSNGAVPSSDAVHPRPSLRLRDLTSTDRSHIERILRATAAFTDAEVLVALELVDERPEVGYRFVVADVDGAVAGYACFGETPCTVGTYDLFWIAVDPARQNVGLGRKLLDAVEHAVRAENGRLLVIETASKPEYAATRAFYERCGLELTARIPDFYARGDDKLVYCRRYDS